VPEAAAGRRVRIVTGDGEALGARGRARPGEMRRLVAAGAAEAEIGGENVRLSEVIAVLEAVALHRERHGQFSLTVRLAVGKVAQVSAGQTTGVAAVPQVGRIRAHRLDLHARAVAE